MSEFIKNNAWNIIFSFAAGFLAWGMLQTRVVALENWKEKNEPLVERFLQLEERDKILVEDVKEVKADVKKLLQAEGIK